jgi:hypothetical protein
MASSTVPRSDEVGALRERTTSPLEVWPAPSPWGLGSRSIARAEGPARPSPAMRVSGLTADDRCRGNLRLALAHHCDRRGCGWSSRLPARERNGSRRSHRTDQLARSSTAIIGGRPSWRTRADRVRSNGTAPDWPCDLNPSSPPPSLHIGCPSWLHTSKQVCSLGPSRTRHANLHLMSTPPGPCFCPASNLGRLRHDGGPEGSAVLSNCTCPRSTGHRDCRGLAGPLVLG